MDKDEVDKLLSDLDKAISQYTSAIEGEVQAQHELADAERRATRAVNERSSRGQAMVAARAAVEKALRRIPKETTTR